MEGQLIQACAKGVPYVGIGGCSTFEGQPKGIIITKADFGIAPAVVDKLYVLQTQARVANVKVWPLLDGLVNLEPNGGDLRTSQEGFGPATYNGHNPYSEVYTYTKGGICLYKELEQLQGEDVRIFFVDDNDKIFGNVRSDGYFQGFLANFGIDYRKNTGGQIAAVKVALSYSANYFNEFKNTMSILMDGEIKPLRMVIPIIEPYEGDTSNAYLTLAVRCSNVNASGSAKGMLTVTNVTIFDSDGAGDNPSSLTYIPTENRYLMSLLSGLTFEDIPYLQVSDTSIASILLLQDLVLDTSKIKNPLYHY